jgi:hypothetical protein
LPNGIGSSPSPSAHPRFRATGLPLARHRKVG